MVPGDRGAGWLDVILPAEIGRELDQAGKLPFVDRVTSSVLKGDANVGVVAQAVLAGIGAHFRQRAQVFDLALLTDPEVIAAIRPAAGEMIGADLVSVDRSLRMVNGNPINGPFLGLGRGDKRQVHRNVDIDDARQNEKNRLGNHRPFLSVKDRVVSVTL